jgi:hypothetical protein
VRTAEELAEATGRSLRQAALVLAAWERAGCRPGPGDIAALDVLGIGDTYEPRSAAIEAVLRCVKPHSVQPTRTQAAVLLALAGTRDEALRLLDRDVVTAEQAMAALTGVVMWGPDARRTGNG